MRLAILAHIDADYPDLVKFEGEWSRRECQVTVAFADGEVEEKDKKGGDKEDKDKDAKKVP